MILPWSRPRFVAAPAKRHLELFCFSTSLSTAPLNADRHGIPGDEAMRGVEVRELSRAMDPAWFDGFRSGSLRTVATAQLGAVISQLDEATQLTAVLFEGPDAPTLTHLQACWGVAQWLCERGATVVLDAQTQRYWRRDEVLDWPANRPFNLSTDVTVSVEETPLPDGTFLVHTRGLARFARPDLLLPGIAKPEWDKAGGVLRTLAAELAAGAVFKAGEQFVGGPVRVAFTRYGVGGALPEVHLNNDGLVVQLQP
jgi:hypothetical protein